MPSGSHVLVLAFLFLVVEATGETKRSYSEGESVPLLANKLTSNDASIPLDYYYLPFCQPEGGPTVSNITFGQQLVGDRIQSTPYELKMKTETYCKVLCKVNLGDGKAFKEAIRDGYEYNYILDDLPAASRVEDWATITTRYWGGSKIGYIDPKTNKAYIHNQINIMVMYHVDEWEANRYQVTRVTVEPFSFRPITNTSDSSVLPCGQQNGPSLVHTDWDLITAKTREPQLVEGEVLFTYDVTWMENKDLSWDGRWDIYETMDDAIPGAVHWIDQGYSVAVIVILFTLFLNLLIRDLRYRSEQLQRGEADNEEEPGWWSRCSCQRIVRPMLTCVAICGVLTLLLVSLVNIFAKRSMVWWVSVPWSGLLAANALLCGAFVICIGRDMRYRPLLAEDNDDEETGDGDSSVQNPRLWPLSEELCAPPKHSPLLLAICCGAGAQILATTIVCTTATTVGVASSSKRGSVIMLVLLTFTLMGSVGGYVTSRLYKAFGGYLQGTLFAACATALGFPGMAFLSWLLLDLFFASRKGSTYGLLSNSPVLVLTVLWLGVMTPLAILGALCGFRQELNKNFPCRDARNGEDSEGMDATTTTRCADKLHSRILITGLLPSSAMKAEWYFVFSAIWYGQYYQAKFLLVATVVSILTAVTVSVLLFYRQCRSRNYGWWWLSFAVGPSCAIYFYIFSIFYYLYGSPRVFGAPLLIYFGTTAVTGVGIALAMGFVGVASCFSFASSWRRHSAAQASSQ